MNTQMSRLGERIRSVRGAISQTEFSNTFGINQNTLSRYERGERTPDAEFIALICERFGISPVWLLFGTGPMAASPGPQAQEPQAPTSEPTPEPVDWRSRCARLEEKMEHVERQRDELMNENRQLWRENSALQARCATLEEQHKHTGPVGLFSKQLMSSSEPHIEG